MKPDILTDDQDPLWFKDAIIYELHIKAFHDSNADGIGDFNGLIAQLDYLQDLGVTAIWLLPFYPSPQRDGGYDISDYFTINPDYGTVKQFKKLLKQAHLRGLKVITELVINHTSDQHPWFQRARKAKPGSKFRDYYVWSDTPEKYEDVRIIFQDFESSNWTWDPVAQAYYWHRFYTHQPDLNYDNPAVQDEVFKIIDFWIDLGVDGFRLDAVPYLFERDGTNCENLPETHVYLKKLRAHVAQKAPHVMLLAEANMWPEDSASYFGDGDECHMNYHFPIMPRMFMALKMEDRYPIIDIIDQTPDIPDNCQWGMFLRNHDELTLEMVTDEERDYMYRAYNKDSLSRINLGIRHRLAPLLDNHRQKIELMNCLLFSLPGTPVVYYGDEIGMGDNVHLGDRDGVRTPMQWSPDRNAGFSQAHPHKLYLPLINDPEYHYETVNVETFQNNSSSLLWWMKRIMGIRKRYQAFGRGDIQFLSPENAKVLAFTRSYQDQHLLILANLSRHPQAVALDLPEFEGYRPVEMFGHTPFPTLEATQNRFTLGPYGYYWFELERDVQHGDAAIAPISVQWNPENWTRLAKGKGLTVLAERVLPKYLVRSGRFLPSERVLDAIEVERTRLVTVDTHQLLFLVLKGHFTEGFPEWYFLPLMLVESEEEVDSRLVVAELRSESGHAILLDATEEDIFHQYLLAGFHGQQSRASQVFRFVRKQGVPNQLDPEENLSPRLVKTSGQNIPLVFGDRYFLKLFRRLEQGINPDVEINQRGEKALPVPGYLGHWQVNGESGKPPFTLAMLQPFVANQGSAWTYFFDAARRYLERVQTESSLPTISTAVPAPDAAVDPALERLTGSMPLERAQLLGETVAALHTGLLLGEDKAFSPEEFSLHYQRSLYSSFQTLVRSTFQKLRKQQSLAGATELLASRKALMDQLKQIYAHKLDAFKVRIHGDLHLDKVLFTGKAFCLFDFEGERIRSFSELRLRKSPLRDIASLGGAFYDVAFEAFSAQVNPESLLEDELSPWVEAWYDCLLSAFLKGYLPAVRAAGLIPDDSQDWQMLLRTFLIERHLYELGFRLRTQTEMVEVPIRGLLRLVEAVPVP